MVQCAMCRQRIERWQALSRAMHEAAPSAEAFSGDGVFWVRLTPHLGPPRRSSWSLISLLPPFIFVSLGTVIDLLIGAVVLMRLLVRMGAIPPVGPVVCTQLRSFLSRSAAGGTLIEWIDPVAHQVATHFLDAWAAMSPTLQDALLYVLLIACLGVALVGIVTLYGWWAACWTRQVRTERSKRTWNTAS